MLKIWTLAVAVFLAFQATAALGQTPLRLIVPYPPGGSTDTVARILSPELSTRLGQPVVIMNQPGAAGYVASFTVNRAEPNGNTLLVTNLNHVLIPLLKPDAEFDVLTGFKPVMLIGGGPLIVVANPSFPHKTMPDLIAAARAAPGTINYASQGLGSIPHLATELLSTMTGTKMTNIAYRGGSQAMVDLIAGVVPIYFSAAASALPYLESKQAIVIAQTSKERTSFAKDIPTVAEQLNIDYDVMFWHGIVAPPRTPDERIRKIHSELAAIVNSPDIRDALHRQGLEVRANTPQDFQRYLESESKIWLETAKAAGVKAQ